MKPAVFSLVVAAMAALALTTTDGALAQKKGAAPKGPDPAQIKAELMTKLPGWMQTAKVTCTPTDARMIGAQTDPATKVISTYAEVACQEGLGYIVKSDTTGAATAEDCIAHIATPVAAGAAPDPTACSLPGNANPTAVLQPYLVKAGSKCAVDKARLMAFTATARLYEVACKTGDGVVLLAPAANDLGGNATVMSCSAAAVAANRNCTLTTEEANMAPIKALVAKSDKANCQVAKQRFVMAATTGDYYEFACADGSGFMLLTNNGEYVKTTLCTQATGISGGCTLSDVKQAATEENALYTKLAKAAGFNCDVNKYGVFPTGGGKEIVELACSNRPDGAVAIFSGDGKGVILNCGRASAEGYRCSYTEPAVMQTAVTEQLKGQGKTTCQVNGLRVIGKTATDAYLEVSCLDGQPGWVIQYPLGVNEPKQVLSCAQASGIGSGCQMPTNKRG